MRKSLLLGLALLARPVWAAAPASQESKWLRSVEAVSAAVNKEAPQNVAVKMIIDRSTQFGAFVTENAQGINLEVSRSGRGSFWITGYLKAHANLKDPRRSWAGADIMGDGVNVDIRPFGSGAYILSGIYKDAEGKERSLNIRVDAFGQPLRDMSIHQKGLDLELRWRASGYVIEGKADAKVYGKRELAVLGAAIATATFDLWRL